MNKKFFAWIGLLPLFLCGWPARGDPAIAHVDPMTGIVFHQALAGLNFERMSRYPGPGAGYSLRYRGEGGTYADVYIYDRQSLLSQRYSNKNNWL